MAGLVSAIHVFECEEEDVKIRREAGMTME